MTKKKDPNELQDMGRPTAYKPVYAEQARNYCLLGATDIQLADFFEVCEKTINTWKHKHPDFLQSIKRGKALADAKMAERLYERGMGYTHEEEKIFQHNGKIIRATTTKHYPPDTQAASLWLRNRQPELWRDQKDISLRQPDKEPRTAAEVLARRKELDEELAILLPQLE